MNWIKLDPVGGEFTAEGNGQTVTSYKVQGVGTIIHYQRESELTPESLTTLRLISPMDVSDRLAVSIIGEWNYTANIRSVSTFAQSTLLNCLAPGERAELMQRLDSKLDNGDTRCRGLINDLVPLCTSFLSPSCSEICVVAFPDARLRGLTNFVCYPNFRLAIQAHVQDRGQAASLQARLIEEKSIALEKVLTDAIYVSRYQNETLARSTHGADETIKAFTFADEYIEQSPIHFDVCWGDVIAVHTYIAIKEYQNTAHDGELLMLLFKKLPEMCKLVIANRKQHMLKDGVVAMDEDAIITALEDVWITLIFRAFCWQRLHFKLECSHIDPAWLNSSIPVYIA